MSALRRDRSGIGEAATVFIVAASDVVRAGLEALMESDARFTVVGSAAALAEFAAQGMEGTKPDIILFDAERQDRQAREALRAFSEEAAGEGSAAPALVVIGDEQSDAMLEAWRAGIVRALLPGTASGSEIIAAVEAVSAGLFVLGSEKLAALLFAATPSLDRSSGEPMEHERSSPIEAKLDALTLREREVLNLLAEGLSNKELAGRMNISEHTVKFHVASIFAKLDVSTRTEAVMHGLRRGLVMM